MISMTYLHNSPRSCAVKGSKLLSDTNPIVTARSDSLVIFNSDGSDTSVVTPYSDTSSDGVYSVVVRFNSVYSD